MIAGERVWWKEVWVFSLSSDELVLSPEGVVGLARAIRVGRNDVAEGAVSATENYQGWFEVLIIENECCN